MCTTGEQFLFEPVCRDKYALDPNNDLYINRVSSYCDRIEKIGTPECQEWCLGNPGKCDRGVADYCVGSNANLPFCSCLNPYLNVDGSYSPQPQCIDDNCPMRGYKTRSMARDCGGYCRQVLRVLGKASTGSVDLDCSLAVDQYQLNPTLLGPPDISDSPLINDTPIKEDNDTTLLIFIIIIAAVVLIAIFIIRNSKQTEKERRRRLLLLEDHPYYQAYPPQYPQ